MLQYILTQKLWVQDKALDDQGIVMYNAVVSEVTDLETWQTQSATHLFEEILLGLLIYSV